MSGRRVASLGIALAILIVPLSAYLKLGVRVGGGLVSLRWDRPVDYYVTNRGASGVTAPELQAAVSRAFSTWTQVPSTTAAHRFVGFTGAEPTSGDALTVVGFRHRPELTRTLAAATFDLDDVTGRVLSADIFFNTAMEWSVAPAGQSGRFDLEAVALHEVGHLFGLGHSALGETTLLPDDRRRVLGKRSVMFPLAYPAGSVEGRRLDADDRAGFVELYGAPDVRGRVGAIAGRVTKDGRGVFGAHITATHTRTGDMIGGFSLTPQGDFVINGLTDGLYLVRVEPIDDADVGSFFDLDAGVDVDFLPAFHPRVVAVPRGGVGTSIDVKVTRK